MLFSPFQSISVSFGCLLSFRVYFFFYFITRKMKWIHRTTNKLWWLILVEHTYPNVLMLEFRIGCRPEQELQIFVLVERPAKRKCKKDESKVKQSAKLKSYTAKWQLETKRTHHRSQLEWKSEWANERAGERRRAMIRCSNRVRALLNALRFFFLFHLPRVYAFADLLCRNFVKQTIISGLENVYSMEFASAKRII